MKTAPHLSKIKAWFFRKTKTHAWINWYRSNSTAHIFHYTLLNVVKAVNRELHKQQQGSKLVAVYQRQIWIIKNYIAVRKCLVLLRSSYSGCKEIWSYWNISGAGLRSSDPELLRFQKHVCSTNVQHKCRAIEICSSSCSICVHFTNQLQSYLQAVITTETSWKLFNSNSFILREENHTGPILVAEQWNL